jgi:anti-anti-sigma regulatory factor
MATRRVEVTVGPDGAVVIRPHGQVNADVTVELRHVLVEVIRHTRPPRLILDLADVDELDPLNLGVLAAACLLGDDQRVAVFVDHCSTALADELIAAGVSRLRLRHVHEPSLVRDARRLAQLLLAGLPERWRHTVGVAARAEEIVDTLPAAADAGALVAAAWLHDIGYAEQVRDTGFHPLDGGLHLRGLGWPDRVACLVAHHSEAMCVAEVRGLADRLAQFPREDTAVADALTYADQTVGPNGRAMELDERLADMLRRHGPESPNARAHPGRAPRLRAAVRRVQSRQRAAA